MVKISAYISDELATRLTSIVEYKKDYTKSLYIREALETSLYHDEQWRATMVADFLAAIKTITEIPPVRSSEEIEALKKEEKT